MPVYVPGSIMLSLIRFIGSEFQAQHLFVLEHIFETIFDVCFPWNARSWQIPN